MSVFYHFQKLNHELIYMQKGSKRRFIALIPIQLHMTVMYEEIREEPEAIRKTINENADRIDSIIDQIRKSSFVFVTGSGTSYNAALMLNYTLLENGIRSMAITSSEYSENLIKNLHGDITNIIFSQSGESTDAISNQKLSKKYGFTVIGITNERESQLFRESDNSILTHAGKEKSIAATKSHAVQVAVSMLIDYRLRNDKNISEEVDDICNGIAKIVSAIDEVGSVSTKIRNKVVFLGSEKCYPVALEGGLKFKETSGVVTESYPTREYFHGPVHRLDADTTVIWLTEGSFPNRKIMEKLKALSGEVITIGNGDAVLKINETNQFQKVFNSLVYIQLLANFKAVNMGMDPDHPSNLSKVVRW